MAEKLDAFPETFGGMRKYPYDKWFDGSVWKLVRGTDFKCQLISMQNCVAAKAARQRVRVRTAIIDGNLIIQMIGKRED